jgi:acetyl-CoA synthase
LKVAESQMSIPVAYSAVFEGERVRGDDIYLECGGGTPMVEWVTSRPLSEVDDGRIELFGPDIVDFSPGSKASLAICVEVAGIKMEEDFEPVLERQIHHLLNYALGVVHTGQRDDAGLRISKTAVAQGLGFHHLGVILYTRLHQDFGSIFDKLQVRFFTREFDVRKIAAQAREVYRRRDARIEGLTDESVDVFYACTICQSIAPNHVCVISPEKTGICGSYNWLDCKAACEISPAGPNQAVPKGELLDAGSGQWKGVNEFVYKATHGTTDRCNLYSIMSAPLTNCGISECITAILPMCNGVLTVDRGYNGINPCGMDFNTIVWTIGGGLSTPGFIGHAKYHTVQHKFINAEGGLLRLVWMPRKLKKELAERINAISKELGVPDLLDKIADESVGTTENDILPFLVEKNHPALSMPLIIG